MSLTHLTPAAKWLHRMTDLGLGHLGPVMSKPRWRRIHLPEESEPADAADAVVSVIVFQHKTLD